MSALKLNTMNNKTQENNYALNTDISIVIPCYNESNNIENTYHQLCSILSSNHIDAEIIFIDDGSTDTTLCRLVNLSKEDSRVKYISFSRNFGHQKALKAGLDKAKGKAVITMDADLQHPPTLIPHLIQQWKEGSEIVNTIRINEKKCRFFKKVTSNLFYKFSNFISETQLKAGAADFRLLDRKVVDILKSCHEEFMFLRGMTAWCGFRQCEVSYQAQPRYAGESKYSLKKMISLAFCGITSFSIKPLRLSILLAGIFVLLSLIEIAYVLNIAIFTNDSVPGWSSLAILISILGAAILFILGIIGEYLGKLFIESKNRPEYIIKAEN